MFCFVVVNVDGVWNYVGDIFKIELWFYFYQMIWFYFFCGGLGLIVFIGVYCWWVRYLVDCGEVLEKNWMFLENEVWICMEDLQWENVDCKCVEEVLWIVYDELECCVDECVWDFVCEQVCFKFIFEVVFVGILWFVFGEDQMYLVNLVYECIIGVFVEELVILGIFGCMLYLDDYVWQWVLIQ